MRSYHGTNTRNHLAWWQYPFATIGLCAECSNCDDAGAADDCFGISGCAEPESVDSPFGSDIVCRKSRKDPWRAMTDYKHESHLVAVPTCLSLQEEAAFRRYLLTHGRVLSTGRASPPEHFREDVAYPFAPSHTDFGEGAGGVQHLFNAGPPPVNCSYPVKPHIVQPDACRQAHTTRTEVSRTCWVHPLNVAGLNRRFISNRGGPDRILLSETGSYLLGG